MRRGRCIRTARELHKRILAGKPVFFAKELEQGFSFKAEAIGNLTFEGVMKALKNGWVFEATTDEGK